jgi:hypothetical protein
MTKCNMACLLVNKLSGCNNDGHLTIPKTRPISINACLTCRKADNWLEYCGFSMIMSGYIMFTLCRMQRKKTSMNNE